MWGAAPTHRRIQALKLTGLVDGRIQAGKRDQTLRAGEAIDVRDLCYDAGAVHQANTGNRCDICIELIHELLDPLFYLSNLRVVVFDILEVVLQAVDIARHANPDANCFSGSCLNLDCLLFPKMPPGRLRQEIRQFTGITFPISSGVQHVLSSLMELLQKGSWNNLSYSGNIISSCTSTFCLSALRVPTIS